MRISWHSFASRHLFFPTAHPLDNHRSDFKMFTTLVEPSAAGEWFHCKVLIPSVGTEAQITYNKGNYTNKQLSPSGNSIVWFLQKDQSFLAFWRHFHVTKGIDHGKQDATERTLRRRGTHWLQMQHFVASASWNSLIANAAFCSFKLIIKQFKRRAHSWNVFQHSKRNFVSLRDHVISSIYFSNKLRTKLKVISRYHEVVRSHFVK